MLPDAMGGGARKPDGNDKGRPSTLLDRVLSGAAMFVALSSLAIAVYEASMTRQHDKISVWPYVSAFNSDSGGVYTYNVRNVGLGPALVRSFQVSVDGKRRANWGEVVDALGLDPRGTPNAYTSFGRGTVLLPAARVAILQVGPGPAAAPFHKAFGQHVRVRVCYCSLYDDCWVFDDARQQEPQSVSDCPSGPAADFAL